MATIDQLERMAGKAMFNATFREQLIEDPEAAAKTMRIHLDEGQVEMMKKIRPNDLERLAEQARKVVMHGGMTPRAWQG